MFPHCLIINDRKQYWFYNSAFRTNQFLQPTNIDRLEMFDGDLPQKIYKQRNAMMIITRTRFCKNQSTVCGNAVCNNRIWKEYYFLYYMIQETKSWKSIRYVWKCLDIATEQKVRNDYWFQNVDNQIKQIVAKPPGKEMKCFNAKTFEKQICFVRCVVLRTNFYHNQYEIWKCFDAAWKQTYVYLFRIKCFHTKQNLGSHNNAYLDMFGRCLET